MPEKLLVPSIEQRIAGMLEVTRRMKDETEGRKKEKPGRRSPFPGNSAAKPFPWPSGSRKYWTGSRESHG